jgi:hypothetical protein
LGFLARTKTTKMFVRHSSTKSNSCRLGPSNKKIFEKKQALEKKFQMIEYVVFSEYWRLFSKKMLKTPHI